MTLHAFTTLYNQERKRLHPYKHDVTFSIMKSKVTKKSVVTYGVDEYQRPYEISRTPSISKQVVDTNGFTKLCQAVWEFYLGTILKRISSEGSYRDGRYIKSPNKGISDLMGAYNGKIYFIEIKQAKEKQLESQVKFQKWTEDGGCRYCIVRSFDEIYSLVQEISNLN